jgi:SPP1 family predicted phage head-tail adaptor
VQAGKLDRTVRIERATTVRLGTGEKSRVWIPITAVFDGGVFDPVVFDSAPGVAAGVDYQSTRQAMNSQQLQSEIDAVFEIRYRTDVTAQEDLRIVFEGRKYRIKGVREIGRKRGLFLDCTARAEA